MTGEVPAVAATVVAAVDASPGAQPWPARGAAYYALFVIILATMLNFFDASVFAMMAQRIKVDFHLSDEQLGFLIGPANVIFYVLVGIPMARLVDIYSRKIVLACGIAAIGGITAHWAAWRRASDRSFRVECWWVPAARRMRREHTRCSPTCSRRRSCRAPSAFCSWASSAAMRSAFFWAACSSPRLSPGP